MTPVTPPVHETSARTRSTTRVEMHLGDAVGMLGENLGADERDLQRSRQFAQAVEVLVVERLLEPVVAETFELTAEADRLFEIVHGDRVGHQGEVRTDGLAHQAMGLDVLVEVVARACAACRP